MPDLLDAVARAQALREDLYLQSDGWSGARRASPGHDGPCRCLDRRACAAGGRDPALRGATGEQRQARVPALRRACRPVTVCWPSTAGLSNAGQLRSLIRAAPSMTWRTSRCGCVERHGQVLELSAVPRAVTENGQRLPGLRSALAPRRNASASATACWTASSRRAGQLEPGRAHGSA